MQQINRLGKAPFLIQNKMIEPKDLSQKDLKAMHNMARERYRCAKHLVAKGEASVILSMIDDEFERRGLDVTKLFNGYNPNRK